MENPIFEKITKTDIEEEKNDPVSEEREEEFIPKNGLRDDLKEIEEAIKRLEDICENNETGFFRKKELKKDIEWLKEKKEDKEKDIEFEEKPEKGEIQEMPKDKEEIEEISPEVKNIVSETPEKKEEGSIYINPDGTEEHYTENGELDFVKENTEKKEESRLIMEKQPETEKEEKINKLKKLLEETKIAIEENKTKREIILNKLAEIKKESEKNRI